MASSTSIYEKRQIKSLETARKNKLITDDATPDSCQIHTNLATVRGRWIEFKAEGARSGGKREPSA